MSRYIDAEAILEELSAWNVQDLYSTSQFEDLIVFATIADVQPVRRGKWMEHKDYYNHGWICSSCGNYGYENKEGRPCFSEFCPNCGADMRNDEKVINQL